LILAADVLEHLKDDETAVRKISKAINKSGTFLITVPAFQSLFSRHDELCHHYRRYSKKQLESILKKAGFEIEFISYWNFFLFIPVAFLKLTKKYFGKESGSDVGKTPQIINEILKTIVRIENKIIKQNIPLPFGISIICRAKLKN
tara:strand:+ start:2076 stop:2513 length:438 start_codon:yes stop_codon:yes gene_type:complete